MFDLWKQCVGELSHNIEEENLNTWIRPLQAVGNFKGENNNRLTLFAPNQFVLNKIRECFLPQIKAALKSLTNQEIHLSFAVGSSSSYTDSTSLKGCAEQHPGINSSQTNSRTHAAVYGNIHWQDLLISNYSFENFIAGPSNQMALSAAKEVAQNRQTSYNPLFIRGGVGLGKTHLLHAVGNKVISQDPNVKVLYLHSVLFVRQVVKALCSRQNNHEQIEALRRRLRTVDVLLVDDVQMLKDKKHCQEEFFHLFNTLFEFNKRIIFAGDMYPQEMGFIEKRLRSRFSSGLLQSISPPELETKIAILQQKGRRQNFSVPKEVANYISNKIHTVRALEGALQRLKACSEFQQQAPITLALAQNAVADLIAPNETLFSIEKIQNATARSFQVSTADLSCPRRTRSLVRPRQIAMYLCKKLTDKSLPEIGAAFGGRDHTTVIYACRKIKAILKADSHLHQKYKEIKLKLQQEENR